MTYINGKSYYLMLENPTYKLYVISLVIIESKTNNKNWNKNTKIMILLQSICMWIISNVIFEKSYVEAFVDNAFI